MRCAPTWRQGYGAAVTAVKRDPRPGRCRAASPSRPAASLPRMPSTPQTDQPTTAAGAASTEQGEPAAEAAALDLSQDVTTLTAAICDIESVSHEEARLADAIEAALRPLDHLEVTRDGNTVVARTSF